MYECQDISIEEKNNLINIKVKWRKSKGLENINGFSFPHVLLVIPDYNEQDKKFTVENIE